MHCSQKGPYFRDRVPIGTFLTFGSLFIFQGPYFQCFGEIHTKNVNSVCMYTIMSRLDLCSLKTSIALRNGLHTCSHWFCVTLLANFGSYLCLHVGFHKSCFESLFWLPRVPIWSLFYKKVGSLLGPYF